MLYSISSLYQPQTQVSGELGLVSKSVLGFHNNLGKAISPLHPCFFYKKE